jgi:predicted hotdog family 3-hydroxylacyl-ACP dehydratase
VEALAAAASGVEPAAGSEHTGELELLDEIVVSDPDLPLTAAQVHKFLVDGYVVLPGIVPGQFNLELMASVDELMEARTQHTIGSGDWSNGLIAGFGQLGALCSWPPIVEKVKQLMANYGNGRVDCGMHHIHATRQDAGTGSSPWVRSRCSSHTALLYSVCFGLCCCGSTRITCFARQ